MDEAEWKRLWELVLELTNGFEPGAVFIGGVAVFAHTRSSPRFEHLIAFSHDADLMISVADYTDLKDIEQITPNRRLRKCQFYKGGFEFDVYVDGQHGLCVPYDEVAAHSEIRSGVRVACLEHLVVLKLRALVDRQGSAKGDKDADDVLKLLLLLGERGATPGPLARFDDSHSEALTQVIGSDAAVRLAHGNLHQAAGLRRAAAVGAASIGRARHGPEA